MSDPISRATRPALPAAPIRAELERGRLPSSSTAAPPTGRFADALRAARTADAEPTTRIAPAASPAAPSTMRTVGEAALRGSLQSITRGERLVNGVISAARHGATFSNEQLIAIQAGVYKYTQELELAGKLVDKATGAIRQTLQSQQ